MNSLAKGRRAFLLAEMAAAGVLLMGAMLLTVQMLGWTAAQRRGAERRGRALQEAANAMERLSALPWDRLTTADAKASAKLSDASAAVLLGGTMDVTVEEVPLGKTAMKRISLAVRWRSAGGVAESPVRLASWVARREVRR